MGKASFRGGFKVEFICLFCIILWISCGQFAGGIGKELLYQPCIKHHYLSNTLPPFLKYRVLQFHPNRRWTDKSKQTGSTWIKAIFFDGCSRCRFCCFRSSSGRNRPAPHHGNICEKRLIHVLKIFLFLPKKKHMVFASVTHFAYF